MSSKGLLIGVWRGGARSEAEKCSETARAVGYDRMPREFSSSVDRPRSRYFSGSHLATDHRVFKIHGSRKMKES